MGVFIFIFMPLGAIGLYALADLISVLQNNERAGNPFFYRLFEFAAVIVLPIIFLLLFDYGEMNNCCSASAFFSPAHRLTIYSVIFVSVVSYYYCTLRTRTAAPLLEMIVNAFLVMGLLLCILMIFHSGELFEWLCGIPAVACFLISQLILNHRQIIAELAEREIDELNSYNRAILKILRANVFLKFPILLLISIPLLLALSLILYIYGQRPDSAIRAFTETYKHGFSQWDYQCENVHCGGHYLCSVAANGHTRVVKPVRIGKRNGHYIICNRQLLVSNAFEDLVQDRFPALHRFIRKQYDKVGDSIHRNYEIYSKKWVSDIVYILMKPAEWFFVVVLYLADRKPEQRIARQYAPWN